jgi:hypothetical protein
MKSFRVPIFAALVAAVVALAGNVAVAHTVEFPTSLSISRSPGGTVAPGTRVTFSGKLSSERHRCEVGSRVTLIKIGEGPVGSDRTNDHGRYSISERVSETARFRTTFGGKVLNAVHPHDHTCGSSASPRIRVPVG